MNYLSFFRWHLRLKASGVGFLLASSVNAYAANVSLTADDPQNFTSFTASTNWSNTAAPTSGNAYYTGAFSLRTTEVAATAQTFAGDSLSIDSGGALGFKTDGLITINNLTLNGGTLTQSGVATNTGSTTATLTGTSMSIAANSSINALSSGRILVIQSAMSGVGGLNIQSTTSAGGAAVFTGVNTYTGATTISSGATLQIGNGGTGGALSTSSSMTNNGTLAFNRTNTMTQGTDFNSLISGTGALTQAGSGTLVLNGTNTYTGATTVNTGGVLNIQNANALGTTAAGTSVTSGAALQIQGGITTGAEALTLRGTGVSTDGALRNISGTNTYAGLVTLGEATRINSDSGTLTLSNAGTISGATFGLSVGGVGNTTIASIIGTTSGTLTKDGAGTLTLTGANTYTGATTVSAGTLQIGNGNLINGPTGSGSISSSSAVSTAAGATLSISLKNNTSLSNNIANTGNVTFLSGGTTAGTGITNTYQGVISGTGSVTKAGIGIAIVNATQAYTGTTTISQGRLQIGTNNSSTGALSPSSAITNNGTLQFARGNTVTQGADFASVISGTGVVQQEGSGTLVLNGANTYTGATTVSFGTLQIGDGGTTGSLSTSSALTNNATLTFNRSNTVTQGTDFASVISGTGAVTQAGSGTLVLSGTNTYGGATTVSTGVLEVSGASGALTATSAVNINGGTLLLSGSAANRISNTAAISLGAATGSTLQFSGAVTETLGALTLAGGAGVRVIDFGATSGVLTFASLTAASSLPVQIWNWSGNLGIGGGTDRLFITSGAFGGSLAASDISFFSGPGTGLYSGTTAFTSGGELVPVPEASTLLAVLGLIAPLAWRERRHWMRCREARGN